jgi:hypothetical protein
MRGASSGVTRGARPGFMRGTLAFVTWREPFFMNFLWMPEDTLSSDEVLTTFDAIFNSN